MAARKKTAKKTSGKSAPAAGGTLDKIVDALAEEAAAVGWRNVTMEAVAARAGLGLGEVLLEAPTKTHLLCAVIDRIDARTLAPVKKLDPEDSPRDRLFEILMRRFDALNERRDAAKAVISGIARDPAALVVTAVRLQRSFAAILAAAGVSTSGLKGLARIQGLKAVTAFALRAWMTDDSADLSKTMAALDRALNRAEKLAGMVSFRRRDKVEEATA